MRKLGKREDDILMILKGHTKKTEMEIREKLYTSCPIYFTLNIMIKKRLILREKSPYNYTYYYFTPPRSTILCIWS